jgi:hypothetical protein
MKIRNVIVSGRSNYIVFSVVFFTTYCYKVVEALFFSYVNYLTGGDVLKLLRIKSLRKKGIKAGSSCIVNKLPYKGDT